MVVSAILGILQPVLGLLGGWFTQADWDNGGLVVNQAYAGLKQLSGQTYPDIQKKLDTVHDKWRTFQYAAPWDKQNTATAYYQECANVAQMIKAQTESLSPVAGKINWQKFLLSVIGGAGFLTFAILLIKYIKEKKR